MKRARDDLPSPRADFVMQGVSDSVREQVRKHVVALVFGGAAQGGKCAWRRGAAQCWQLVTPSAAQRSSVLPQADAVPCPSHARTFTTHLLPWPPTPFFQTAAKSPSCLGRSQ